jgi:hypothetical protein
MNDKMHLWIVLVLLVAYVAMVFVKLAPADGFAVLAAYVVKKAFDIADDQVQAKIEAAKNPAPTEPPPAGAK